MSNLMIGGSAADNVEYEKEEQMYTSLLNREMNKDGLYINFQNQESSTGLVDYGNHTLKLVKLNDIASVAKHVKELLAVTTEQMDGSFLSSIAYCLSEKGKSLPINLDIPQTEDELLEQDRIEEDIKNSTLRTQTKSNLKRLQFYRIDYNHRWMLSIPLAFYLKEYYKLRVGDAIIKFILDYNFDDKEYETFLTQI